MPEPAKDEATQRHAQAQKIADEIALYASKVERGMMRTAYLARRIKELDDETAIEVLDALCAGATLSRRGFHEILSDIIDPVILKEQVGDFMFSRIYHGARRSGKQSILRFLSEARPARIQDGPSEENMQFGLGDMPLGVRKSVARLNDRALLDRAGFDQDPRVIGNLLTNPRTTREMVLKIASRRPNEASVLEAIFKSKRWISDQTVKEALVRNPYTPPRISMGLLNLLLLQQLKDVVQDTGLHDEVREAALEALRRKEKAQQKTYVLHQG